MTATLSRATGTAGPDAGGPGADVAARAPRPRASRARLAAWIVLGLIVAAAVAALVSVDISIPRMVQSLGNAQRFAGRIGALTLPEPADLLRLTAQTLGFVITGTVLAAVLSVPVAVLAASNTSPGPAWQGGARFVGVLARSVPDVVLAMVFVLMFSLGSLPGILAVGIHSVGMLSKMFADAIEQIDEGPRLAIRAAGGSRLQELAAGVLPQVAPSWVANVLHRNDINLRGSVILGYVGVAGLGLQMSYAFKALDYGRGLGLAAVIFALCVVMEVVSAAVRAAMLGAGAVRTQPMDRLVRRLLPRRAPGGSAGGAIPSTPDTRPATPDDALRRPWTPARVRTAVALAVAALVLVGAVLVSDITWSDLGTFWARIPAVAAELWPPDAGAYGWPVLVGAMGQTVVVALAAALLTLAGSAVIGALAARNVAPGPGIRGAARLVLVAVRGVPELILAIVLIVISGLGMQAGTIALAVGGMGLLGKLVADSLEEVDPGPERALTATGATRPQVLAAATLPQAARAMLGHGFYLLDTNIRAATLLGIVGGGGVGYYLLNASEGARYGMVTAIVLMILATVLVVEGVAVWMRRVLR
ncbi:PhnE/PtxC family ABC transporter permease [Clavibacter michiganensis]|nr:ABC transporter permease subunit [Clavibacter michiganensis]AWG00492.1 phosphate starvation protein PhoH [Clavibacter michiganensis subsp. insidiosus]OQJ60891.1 phosphate starvation-inducible protein PhoH [Clavibacter michiganensis subsp. insidiosus]RMC83643.1 ABC transporter permease subunit [Clavibacter michiganensis subsp. insidiosus]